MQVGRYNLTDEQVRALRRAHPYEPDQSWVPEVAAAEGWLAVNRRYLDIERNRAADAMSDLMRTLGVGHVTSREDATDLVELAIYVFAPEDGYGGKVQRDAPSVLRIENAACPTFNLIERQDWHGVTACASWHRRRGWLDAIGARASDSVMAEQKWGDPACVAVLSIEAVPQPAG